MVGETTNPPSSICYRTCTPGGFLGGSPCSHPYPAPRLGGYCTAPTPPPRGHPVLAPPPQMQREGATLGVKYKHTEPGEWQDLSHTG